MEQGEREIVGNEKRLTRWGQPCRWTTRMIAGLAVIS